MARRIRLYLTGLILGILVVYIMFKDRDWLGWLPGNRVLTDIQSDSSLIFSDHLDCWLDCYQLDTGDVFTLLEEGSAEIQRSENGEYHYFISMPEKADTALMIHFLKVDTTYRVMEIELEGKKEKCDCKNIPLGRDLEGRKKQYDEEQVRLRKEKLRKQREEQGL